VIDGEALPLVSVSALIVFAQDTAVEDAVDADVCRGRLLVADVEGVPVANPKVELVVLGRGAGFGLGSRKCGQEEDDRELHRSHYRVEGLGVVDTFGRGGQLAAFSYQEKALTTKDTKGRKRNLVIEPFAHRVICNWVIG